MLALRLRLLTSLCKNFLLLVGGGVCLGAYCYTVCVLDFVWDLWMKGEKGGRHTTGCRDGYHDGCGLDGSVLATYLLA